MVYRATYKRQTHGQTDGSFEIDGFGGYVALVVVKGQYGVEVPLQGEVPSAVDVPGGCPFHPRCAFARPVCAQEMPALVSDPVESGRSFACHAPLGND